MCKASEKQVKYFNSLANRWMHINGGSMTIGHTQTVYGLIKSVKNDINNVTSQQISEAIQILKKEVE